MANNRKEDSSWWRRYERMLFYAFYQPYMVSLIVLYPEFERQISVRKTKTRNWTKVCARFCPRRLR